jgi:trigger factor
VFNINMLPGGYGDCLWIEYGDPEKPWRILIDAGTLPTYKDLRKYIEERLSKKDRNLELFLMWRARGMTIEAPGSVTIDDDYAKSLGLDSLDKLRVAVKDRIASEHAGMSRQKLKRMLLDRLDEMHKFAPPPTLVEEEFANVWNAIETDLKQQGRTFADDGTTEEASRTEYRAIAERRVRLGLVLADIGEKNNIKVADDEISRAIVERARQVPGREQEIWDYYRKNPAAVAGVRAPIFEEKVVDFLTELAAVTDKPVSREDLYKDDDEVADEKAPAAQS